MNTLMIRMKKAMMNDIGVERKTNRKTNDLILQEIVLVLL